MSNAEKWFVVIAGMVVSSVALSLLLGAILPPAFALAFSFVGGVVIGGVAGLLGLEWTSAL